jgi:hypothetical protein
MVRESAAMTPTLVFVWFIVPMLIATVTVLVYEWRQESR